MGRPITKTQEFHTNDPLTAKISVAYFLADASTPHYDDGDKVLVEWLTRFTMAYEVIDAMTRSGKRGDELKAMIDKIKTDLKTSHEV